MEKITGRKNSRLVHAKNLGKDRNYRAQHGEFLCDGKKLLIEAISSNVQIVSVFSSEKLGVRLPMGAVAYEVDSDVLSSISPLKNAQNVLFICKMPRPQQVDYSCGTHILLDSVQDPGNIGTILRSAVAFGIDSVILTGDCADPYNPKAIRASMGAIFKHKFVFLDIRQMRELNAKFVGTGCDSGFTPIRDADLNNTIIALGNEGRGISDDVKALCNEFITIPIADNCESLNVAAAASIVMWEVRNVK